MVAPSRADVELDDARLARHRATRRSPGAKSIQGDSQRRGSMLKTTSQLETIRDGFIGWWCYPDLALQPLALPYPAALRVFHALSPAVRVRFGSGSGQGQDKVFPHSE